MSEITYEFHKNLSQKIWKNEKIKENVKEKLLDVAFLWLNESGIDTEVIIDIVLTGSYAGYNYTPYSDLDIHIILDKKMIGCEGLIDDFLFDKKKIFSDKHNITINDIPVEVYAQDKNEKVPDNEAVYSLLNDKWIVTPSKQKIDIFEPKLLKKSRFYKKMIIKLIKESNIEKIILLKSKLRRMRQAGLEREGEFSTENIVYKDLRNRNLLQKLDDRLNYLIDKRYSM